MMLLTEEEWIGIGLSRPPKKIIDGEITTDVIYNGIDGDEIIGEITAVTNDAIQILLNDTTSICVLGSFINNGGVAASERRVKILFREGIPFIEPILKCHCGKETFNNEVCEKHKDDCHWCENIGDRLAGGLPVCKDHEAQVARVAQAWLAIRKKRLKIPMRLSLNCSWCSEKVATTSIDIQWKNMESLTVCETCESNVEQILRLPQPKIKKSNTKPNDTFSLTTNLCGQCQRQPAIWWHESITKNFYTDSYLCLDCARNWAEYDDNEYRWRRSNAPTLWVRWLPLERDNQNNIIPIETQLALCEEILHTESTDEILSFEQWRKGF